MKTPEEIAREIVEELNWEDPLAADEMQTMIAQAIATERKACAWPDEETVEDAADAARYITFGETGLRRGDSDATFEMGWREGIRWLKTKLGEK